MTDQAKAVANRVAKTEPLSRLHQRTNLDSAVMATVLVEVAKATFLLLPLVAGAYVVCWLVLAIKGV